MNEREHGIEPSDLIKCGKILDQIHRKISVPYNESACLMCFYVLQKWNCILEATPVQVRTDHVL
jgi:hypothetical protein